MATVNLDEYWELEHGIDSVNVAIRDRWARLIQTQSALSNAYTELSGLLDIESEEPFATDHPHSDQESGGYTENGFAAMSEGD